MEYTPGGSVRVLPEMSGIWESKLKEEPHLDVGGTIQ